MNRLYYLPPSTARLLNEDRIRRCKNLGLILDKYIPQEAIQKSEGKGNWLKKLDTASHMDPRLAENAYLRWRNTTQAANAQRFSGITDWRIVVGLGGETVLETDLTLHHLYGIPYIPGSALKGLTRAYATSEEEEGHLSKKIDEDDETIQQIFGSQERAGSVIFFDAMPVNGYFAFDLDIMNAHYPDYYGQNKAPTNDQNPNPITFLTVADTVFMFALAPRRQKNEQDVADVGKAKEWLKKALAKYGVGGKTSAGYGYFTDIHDEKAAGTQTEATQTATTSVSPSSPAQQPPAQPIRPNIPAFRAGESITGSVVAPTDELRKVAPTGATAFLRYQSFATKDLIIIISTVEARNWKPGETRICLFEREEVHDGITMLICQPRPPKKDKEGKKR